jgi:protein-disulfide isomerase
MFKKLLLTTCFISTAMVGVTQAQDLSRDDVKEIIKEYIQNNPGVILDSVEEHGRKQQRVDSQQQQKAIEKNIGWFEDNASLPIAGNKDGDVTIVEFFDYNCGYCKKAIGDILTILQEDKNVKFVFIETPILGQTSKTAAKWAMAAENQEAYLEYHTALMKHRGPLSELSLRSIAKKVGLDVDQMAKDAESEEIAQKINEKVEKTNQMGISGTPAFIINGKLYGGYIGLDRMRTAVKEARQG